jgi:hypothetical protein
MAFASYHNEDAFKAKALQYVTDEGTSLNVVEKKWSRVPGKTSDWAWTRVAEAVEAMELSNEQKDRWDKVKAVTNK